MPCPLRTGPALYGSGLPEGAGDRCPSACPLRQALPSVPCPFEGRGGQGAPALSFPPVRRGGAGLAMPCHRGRPKASPCPVGGQGQGRVSSDTFLPRFSLRRGQGRVSDDTLRVEQVNMEGEAFPVERQGRLLSSLGITDTKLGAREEGFTPLGSSERKVSSDTQRREERAVRGKPGPWKCFRISGPWFSSEYSSPSVRRYRTIPQKGGRDVHRVLQNPR